jgi:DNA-binding LytR/AlgR family response regulator
MKPTPATALIAEDEALLAQHLQSELQVLWPELNLLPVATNGPAAVELALAQRPDVCFLDIRMPGLSGLDAAAAMAEDWPPGQPFPLLVFVTAYDQYALQAFEQAAQDYLLKPVQRERLSLTLTRLKQGLLGRATATATAPAPSAPAAALPSPALEASLQATLHQLQHLHQQLAQLEPPAAPLSPWAPRVQAQAGLGQVVAEATPKLRLLQVSVGNAIQMVKVDDVLLFEAADKYVRVLTPAKEHLIRLSLRELLPQLDADRFWQVHRGTVVRADAIEKAVRDESGKLSLHLRGTAERPTVSRLYSHRFKGL